MIVKRIEQQVEGGPLARQIKMVFIGSKLDFAKVEQELAQLVNDGWVIVAGGAMGAGVGAGGFVVLQRDY